MLLNSSSLNNVVLNGSGGGGGDREVGELPPIWIATRYRCYLSGAEDGQPTDLELPISSFQARLKGRGLSMLSVVIKGVDEYLDGIQARPNGKLSVHREYVLDDGSVQSFEMIQVPYTEMQLYSGGRAGITGQLYGSGRTQPDVKMIFTLRNPSYYSLSGDKRRYRCELEPRLRPGDTAIIRGDVLIVGQIIYIVDVKTAVMEVAEE